MSTAGSPDVSRRDGPADSPPPGPSPPGPPPPPGPSTTVATRRRTRWAVAATAVALVGLVVPVLGGVAAIIVGAVALVRVATSEGTRTGAVMSSVAIVIGIVGAIGWVAGLAAWDGFDAAVVDFQAGVEGGLAGDPVPVEDVLDPGDCVDLDLDAEDSLFVDERDRVDCDGPHAAEFLGVVQDDAPDDADWPGDDEVFETNVGRCIRLFEDAVGRSYDDAVDLDVFLLMPDGRGWNLGDREVACFVIAFDATDLTSKVIGRATEG